MCVIFDESWEILDQAKQVFLTRHNRAMSDFGDSKRGLATASS
jgi:hypothetical protein